MFAPAHHSAMKHRRPGARRARLPDGLQPARPAVQSGGVKRLSARRVLAATGSSRSPNVLGDPRRRSAPGWSTATAASTRFRSPGRRKVAELKNGRVDDLHDHARRRRPEHRTRSTRSRAATPSTTPRRSAPSSTAQSGPYRDTVLLNAAAALIVAGKAKDLRDGARLAAASIDEGHARDRLKCLIAVSNG